MEFIIETDGITKRFFNVTAIDNISIGIKRGSVFGFLGPNGAGKTTTVRLLNGLIRPSVGTARVLGKDTAREADYIRSRCGVQTDTNLYERLTAFENLDIWARLFGLAPDVRAKRIDTLLDMFGLSARAKEKVALYSKGMKQKLAIARALIHEPEILFLDEPTAGLDPEASDDLTEYLKDYVRDEAHTVFLCSHRLEELELLCDTVAVISSGKIIAQGTVPELSASLWKDTEFTIELANTDTRMIETISKIEGLSLLHASGNQLRVSLSSREIMPGIVRTLIAINAEIVQVKEEKRSLKDIYFAYLPKGGSNELE
jgi:ABC-2 type transport system ATP-binding protein